MWGRYLILGLLLTGGGAVAVPASPPPIVTGTEVQQSDPDTPTEADAETSDPFAQFDLGVASLAQSDTVSEWTELAASGLVLVPETVEVRAGESIDALLIERGVRPDPYARSLVAEINPNLSESFALAEGDSVTLFEVRRPDSGPFATGRIALQPFQAERDAVREGLERLDDIVKARQARQLELQVFQDRIERAEDRIVLTDRLQIRAAGSLLDSYNTEFQIVWRADSAPYQATYEAATELTESAVADIRSLPNDERTASIRVRMSSIGPGPSGPCDVGWAPLGFARHTSSRAFEPYQDDVVIRVPASGLHVWIARSQGEPPVAELHRIPKAQLLDGRTVSLNIRTIGRCQP